MSDEMTSEFMNDFLKDDAGRQDQAAAETADATQAEGTAGEEGGMRGRVLEVLQAIYDPEIPVNIYELGLIYDLDVDADNNVHVLMTLTTPMCPVAESMPGEVETRIREIEGIGEVTVDLTWDPPWDPSRMSEAAKLELGML